MTTPAATPRNKRRRILALILIGSLFFMLSLIINLPAAHAWNWAGTGDDTRAYGIRGTTWNGGADAVISADQRLDGLNWQLQPAALLRGQLGYSVRARLGGGAIEGVVRTGLGGGMRLSNIRFNMGADELVRRFGGDDLPVNVGGHINAFFEEIVLGPDGRPTSLRGLVNWTGGSIDVMEDMPLGDYALRLDTRDGRIVGKLLDTGAVLRLDGDITLVSATGEVSGEVIMQTLEGATEALVNGLKLTGLEQPDAENRVRFRGNVNNPMGFRGELQ